MTGPAHTEAARKTFAELTGELEDASLIAAAGQTVFDVADARHTCDRLIATLEACLGRLQRLRRRLG